MWAWHYIYSSCEKIKYVSNDINAALMHIEGLKGYKWLIVVSDERVNPYSAGIDFSRQNLSKIDPRTVRVNIFTMVADQ